MEDVGADDGKFVEDVRGNEGVGWRTSEAMT